MVFQRLITWFLPPKVRYDKTHPDYYQLFTVACANIIGSVGLVMILVLLILFETGTDLWAYPLGVATYLITLLSLRISGRWRLPTTLCAIVAYFIIYTWLKSTGLIFSVNIAMLHLYVIAAILVDRRWGWVSILSNFAFLFYIYYLTVTTDHKGSFPGILGSPTYALLLHSLITSFIGGLLAYIVRNQEANRKQISDLQYQKINMLDETVRKRTEQLNSMRQTIASDFHDHTGNMLAAINRQASILELKMDGQMELLPLIKSIITNSNELYASSKDFIWNLNHDSDNPSTLFQYLAGYGQNFYNQFDISFSVEVLGNVSEPEQLRPFAALNLIYIFKEAMSNVIKHSGATDVLMTMSYEQSEVSYMLRDNGQWKAANPLVAHYGLENMERRSKKYEFGFNLSHGTKGTVITVSLPLTTYPTKGNTI